jgi:hypothetical protein
MTFSKNRRIERLPDISVRNTRRGVHMVGVTHEEQQGFYESKKAEVESIIENCSNQMEPLNQNVLSSKQSWEDAKTAAATNLETHNTNIKELDRLNAILQEISVAKSSGKKYNGSGLENYRPNTFILGILFVALVGGGFFVYNQQRDIFAAASKAMTNSKTIPNIKPSQIQASAEQSSAVVEMSRNHTIKELITTHPEFAKLDDDIKSELLSIWNTGVISPNYLEVLIKNRKIVSQRTFAKIHVDATKLDQVTSSRWFNNKNSF